MKTYEYITEHSNYRSVKAALTDICRELELELFFPDYHGKKGDGATMLVYTKDKGNGIEQVCSFEFTDRNGTINFNFLNWGKIDFRGIWKFEDTKTVLRAHVEARLTMLNKKEVVK